MKKIKLKKRVFIISLILIISFIGIECNSTEREKVTIRLVSSTMGTGAYFLAFKLADIINKKHPWIKIEAVEGMGSAANLQMLMKDHKTKKNTIFN